jgi:hypothetical protein
MTLAPEVGSKELKIVRGACPHDCPDTCAMLYHVVAPPCAGQRVELRSIVLVVRRTLFWGRRGKRELG